MERKGKENVLIKSEMSNTIKVFPAILAAIGVFFVLLMIKMAGSDLFHGAGMEYSVMFMFGLLLICISIILLLYINNCEIVVTEKRIYGKAAFGKMVSIPLDSVSAIGIGFLQSIAVSSSSGKISFMGIKNKETIYEIISELLSNR